MIHLVTSTTALHDATDWLAPDDIVIIAGDAMNAVHEARGIPMSGAGLRR